MKISIWTWGFYYFDFSFLEILEYIDDLKDLNWVEIVVKDWYKFSDKELKYLSKYKYNTLHLWKYWKDTKDWILYCVKNIPNFCHFVLHPDDLSVLDLNDVDREISKYISFENMDIRKNSHKQPEEMINLFNKFPESKFTFDINHAEENGINYSDFDIVKFPEQLHFSVTNKSYYTEYDFIDTSHALAVLEDWFYFDLSKYKNSIITMEWVFVLWKKDLIQKEIDLIKSLF